MSDEPTLPVTASFTPFDPTHRRDDVAALVKDVESTGVRVTKIHFTSSEAPPRLSIVFTGDEPQWSVRAKLEAKLYDVGQQLGRNDLSFYVTKRVEKTKGWAT